MSDKLFFVLASTGTVKYPARFVSGRSYYDVRAHVRKDWPGVPDDAIRLCDASPPSIHLSTSEPTTVACEVMLGGKLRIATGPLERAAPILNMQELAQEHASSIRNAAFDDGMSQGLDAGYAEALDDLETELRRLSSARMPRTAALAALATWIGVQRNDLRK